LVLYLFRRLALAVLVLVVLVVVVGLVWLMVILTMLLMLMLMLMLMLLLLLLLLLLLASHPLRLAILASNNTSHGTSHGTFHNPKSSASSTPHLVILALLPARPLPPPPVGLFPVVAATVPTVIDKPKVAKGQVRAAIAEPADLAAVAAAGRKHLVAPHVAIAARLASCSFAAGSYAMRVSLDVSCMWMYNKRMQRG
jgi:hypothetical protein